MPLDRPTRPPAGAVTGRVRRAILLDARLLDIGAATLVALHSTAESIGSPNDLLEDVEERYSLPAHSLTDAVNACIQHARSVPTGLSDEEASCILLALPDTEFLTVLENTVDVALTKGLLNAGIADTLLMAADKALRAHGTAYRRVPRSGRFEWVGDPAQHQLTVQPALLALADSRLQGGPRDDFERALRKRRLGAAKDLEDAILAAARAVESTLKVLYEEHHVTKPSKHELAGLFNGLARPDVGILPGYVQQLVLAVGEPRNHMAGHGPGPDVRAVPQDLADASIAAAATAITYLAHQLP